MRPRVCPRPSWRSRSASIVAVSLALRLAKVTKVVLQEELGRVLGDTGADVLVHVIMLYLFDSALAVHRAIRDALRVLGACGERGAMVSTGMPYGMPFVPILGRSVYRNGRAHLWGPARE